MLAEPPVVARDFGEPYWGKTCHRGDLVNSYFPVEQLDVGEQRSCWCWQGVLRSGNRLQCLHVPQTFADASNLPTEEGRIDAYEQAEGSVMKLDDIDFLIIGATKSATTWLQKSLQTDPQIAMPEPELHYFSRELSRGDDWYLAQFPENAANRVAGEKSNSYLESADAAKQIATKLPRVKLVAQLRNPVERAYSDYCMMYRRGEIGRDVARYLDPDRPQNTRLISAGLYHRQLRVFYDRFPSDHILVTLFDDMRIGPAKHLAAVRDFLGLPASQAPTFVPTKVKDKTTPMVSPRLRRALRPMKPMVALFRDTTYFRKIHALLGRETSYAPLPASVRRQLVDYYASDVEALGRMIGRDLSAWLADDLSRLESAPSAKINIPATAQNRNPPKGLTDTRLGPRAFPRRPQPRQVTLWRARRVRVSTRNEFWGRSRALGSQEHRVGSMRSWYPTVPAGGSYERQRYR